MKRWIALLCLSLVWSGGWSRAGEAGTSVIPEGTQPKWVRALRDQCDVSANYLIDRFDLKSGTYSLGKSGASPGINALVLRALLECHRKYKSYDGPFISEPLKNLARLQDDDGSFAAKEFGHPAYGAALALMALRLSEEPRYKENIDKARKFLRKCQDKDGGFSYAPKDVQRGDMSNTWHALAALHAAGEKPDADEFKKALGFIRRCQDSSEFNPDLTAERSMNSGGAYYRPGQSEAGVIKLRDGHTLPKPYGSMTAAALDSYFLSGLDAKAPEPAAALKWLAQNFSVKENPGAGQGGYYYYTVALAKALQQTGSVDLNLPDGRTVNWAYELAKQLLSLQKPDGSFVNPEPQWQEDDPMLCTALALTTMGVCWKELKKREIKK